VWYLTVYSRPYNHLDYGYVTGSGPNRVFFYPPDYAGNSTNIIGYSVDSILRSQRRREIGVGS
jgi:hypothetical protein